MTGENGNGGNGKANGKRMPEGEILTGAVARQHGGRKGNEPLYTVELGQEICQRISYGETLKSICENDTRMPSRSTFLDWVYADRDGLAERYTAAREKLMDHWSEEIVTIADDQNAEPNDRRIRVDTRKWLMSKLAYRKYGDKLVHSGDPDNPIVVMHKKAEMTPLGATELAALERFTSERLTIIDVEHEPVGTLAEAPTKSD